MSKSCQTSGLAVFSFLLQERNIEKFFYFYTFENDENADVNGFIQKIK